MIATRAAAWLFASTSVLGPRVYWLYGRPVAHEVLWLSYSLAPLSMLAFTIGATRSAVTYDYPRNQQETL